jgi:hypothetical protein
MMPKPAVRMVAVGVLALVGTLPASPTDDPKVPAGAGNKDRPAAKDAKDKPKTGLTVVSVDLAGFATFTHERPDANKNEIYPLTFRANDFDDAVRSLRVSRDRDSLAKGSTHPVLPVLRDKKAKDALPGVQLTDLLDSLRGQQVTVTPDATSAPKTGLLLSIDSVGGQGNQGGGTPPAGGTPSNTTPSASKTLTLWSKDAGVSMIPLTSATTIKFTDARITEKVQQALTELARGNGQPPRTVAVRLPGASTITYTHPIAPWDIQYVLNLDTDVAAKTTARLSGRVTVRNSTARPWNEVEIRLTGLPWSATASLENVSLSPDESATFTVGPPCDVNFDVGNDPLTFKNQQTTLNPDRKLTLSLKAGALATIPGPITVVEDGVVAGQADSLDFAGTNATSVTLSPYKLVTVSQSTPKASAPTRISFADGLLTYTNTQTTTFFLTNRSKSNKTLAVTAQAGYTGPAKPNNGIPIPAETGSTPTPYTFVETGALQAVALASWTSDQIASFRKSLDPAPSYDIVRSLLDQVSAQQEVTSKQIADLAEKRQALAIAIGAIAARQPTGRSVIALRVPQLAQDEATVAGLRQRMDLIAAKKAEVARTFEAFVCGQQSFPVVP